MSRKSRLFFISFLVLLFAVISPLIAFYSLGWRFDFKSRLLSQPGIFYFKTYPKNAEVVLDGKSKKKTDFFFGTMMIENMAPKNYLVEIKKDGYYPWKKSLEIKKGEPTEVKNLVLVPINPDFKEVFKDITSYWMSDSSNRIFLEEANGDLSFYDVSSGQKKVVVNKKELKANGKVTEASFSLDENFALIKINSYYLISLESKEFTPVDAKQASFYSNNPYRLLILNNSKLVEFDVNTKKIVSTQADKAVDFKIFNNTIYYLDDSGFLYRKNITFEFTSKINSDPVKCSDCKIIASPAYIALIGSAGLYAISQEDGGVLKIADKADIAKFSLEARSLLYTDNGQIKVFYLKKQDSQPQKLAKDDIFLTRFSDKIDDAIWLNEYYIAVKIGNNIKIVETDDRDKINIADFKNADKISWDKNSKTLYLLDGSTLSRLENLMP